MTPLFFCLKILACSGVLYGYYWLFLRNKRYHRYNRFYLLSTLFLSVSIPLVRIPLFFQGSRPAGQVMYRLIDGMTVGRWHDTEGMAAPAGAAGGQWPLSYWLFVVYGLGLLLAAVSLIRSLRCIQRIKRRYTPERVDDLLFYNTREKGTPFSFFRRIFWNEKIALHSSYGQQIFRHELFHVRQQHSLDILLTELLTALCWFNPFFYLIRKELKAIHEFLADQYAVSGQDRYAYAELLVMQTLQSRKNALEHPFFQNHIKRRIAMLTQTQKTRYTYWSRLMILPVAAALFCVVAFRTRHTHAAAGSDIPGISPLEMPFTVVIDAGHGGADPGAQAPGSTLAEKDIALSISRKIQALAGAYQIKTVMTRTGDQLPGQGNDIAAGLKDRVSIAEKAKASLFVSVHVGAADTPDQSGFEVYITNRNRETMDSSRLLGTALLESLGGLYKADPLLLQRKDKGIWVLDKAPCPAVLIECGYLTNPRDAAFISRPANQEAIARKILEGINAYRRSVTGMSVPAADTLPSPAGQAQVKARRDSALQAFRSREQAAREQQRASEAEELAKEKVLLQRQMARDLALQAEKQEEISMQQQALARKAEELAREKARIRAERIELEKQQRALKKDTLFPSKQ